MNLLQALILGLVQGATEFIPVSSSGHLVLIPWLLNWDKAPLAFDTTVHWGTLLAILVVFWRELRALFRAGLGSVWAVFSASHAYDHIQARLAWAIVVGSIPAALVGFVLEDFFEDLFGKPAAAAALLLVTAAILSVSERLGRRERPLTSIAWLDALFIGLAQACAIMPGISRSGTTIAAGLSRGIQREAAARFSFLLSTPVVFGAGLFKLLDLAGQGGLSELAPALLVGFVMAALSGYVCIRWLLDYLARRPLYVFAAYCTVFGLFNLLIVLIRG